MFPPISLWTFAVPARFSGSPRRLFHFLQILFILGALILAFYGQNAYVYGHISKGSLFFLTGSIFALAALVNWGTKEKGAADLVLPPVPTVQEICLLVLVLCVAAFFRFYELNLIPNGHWFDEANNALLAEKLRNQSFTPFIPGLEQPAEWSYLLCCFMRLVSRQATSLRVLPAFFGFLTVPTFYFLIRKMAGVRPALAGAFLLAVSRWHVDFSRINFNSIQTPFFEVTTLYFLYLAVLRKKSWLYGLSGVSLSLLLYSYLAGRIFCLVLVVFLILQWLKDRDFFKRQGKGLLVFFAVVFFLMLPLMVYVARFPQIFLQRTQQVYILKDVPRNQAISIIFTNLNTTLLEFGYQGDVNGRHNLPGAPLLDFYSSWICTLGCGFALLYSLLPFITWPFKRKLVFSNGQEKSVLAVVWLLVMLIPGVFTIEAPQALRTIGSLPAVFLAGALFLGKAWDVCFSFFHVRWEKFAACFVLLFFGSAAMANFESYFILQAQNKDVWYSFSPAEDLMGKYLRRLNKSCGIYADHAFYPSTVFSAENAPDHQFFDPVNYLPLKQRPNKDIQYVLMPVYRPLIPLLFYYYPGGKLVEFTDLWKEPLFFSFRVKKEEVVSMQGLQATYRRGTQTKQEVVPAELDWIKNPVPFNGPFEVKLSGSVFVESSQKYIFYLESVFPALIKLDGHVFSGQDEIPRFLTAGLHDLEIRTSGARGMKIRFSYSSESEEDPVTVPAAQLCPRPVFTHGLRGVYYNPQQWSGVPLFEQIDPQLNFQWGYQARSSSWDVEWQGEMLADTQGVYVLGIKTNEGANLMVDGRWLFTNLHQEGEVRLFLKQGWHSLRLRCKAEFAGSEIHFWWIKPNQGKKEPVPMECLRPIR